MANGENKHHNCYAQRSIVELSMAISLIAVLISLLSYMFTKRSWYETYRPIVTARIETHTSGNMATAFDIVVYNTGNKPATEIRLHADHKVLEVAFEENASETMKSEIKACFSDNGIIPLLHPGNSTSNGFGVASNKESTLKYGLQIPIIIEYKDLNRRKFKTKQTLLFKDSTFFADSGWKEKDNRLISECTESPKKSLPGDTGI